MISLEIALQNCLLTLFCESSDLNWKPVNSTRFFPLNDLDCPNISGKGGQQDGDVGNGEGEGGVVDQAGRLGCQAEVQVAPEHHHLPFQMHPFSEVGLEWRE